MQREQNTRILCDSRIAPAAAFRANVQGMIWETPRRSFDLSVQGLIMGVLNVTPDSFSDGGQWLRPAAAIAHADQMIREGAAIIDIGGESTRPGAEPVSESEELRRILPVIEELAQKPGHGEQFVMSVDTMKPNVARQAVAAGAAIINDVGGLRDDAMLDAAKDTGAAVVVMHMQGEPRTMQTAPHYEDATQEVRDFFCATYARCLSSGVPAPRIAFDPGIGFGKTAAHNLTLLHHLPDLAVHDRPLVCGVSRKSFLGKITGTTALDDRAWPTVALTSYGREQGARVFRVHDVKPNAEALRMTEAILAG
jgi:dihydropteroate synthase